MGSASSSGAGADGAGGAGVGGVGRAQPPVGADPEETRVGGVFLDDRAGGAGQLLLGEAGDELRLVADLDLVDGHGDMLVAHAQERPVPAEAEP